MTAPTKTEWAERDRIETEWVRRGRDGIAAPSAAWPRHGRALLASATGDFVG